MPTTPSARPLTLMVAVTLALALALAACEAADDPEPAVDEEEDEDVEDAEDAEDEPEEGALEGETITFLVGTSPGGGFDQYTRLVAPYMGEELGADVSVENMTGAGGLLALNQVWAEEPDGTTIGMMNGPGVVGSVLGGAPGIEFDLGEFTYLGRPAGEPRLLTVHSELPYEEPQDLIGLEDEFNFASTGPGGGTHIDAAVAIELFELQGGDIIPGFEGSEESIVAVTAGEADGIITTKDTSLPNVEAGDHTPIAVYGEERFEELEDVPTVGEIEEFDDEQLEMAQAQVSMIEAGRILVAPPGMDEDLEAELRQALDNAMANPDLQADAEEQGLPLAYLTGDETREIVETALDAPDVVREILQDAVGE